MPLCKECEQLGDTHDHTGNLETEGTELEKGERCDRCEKTSYEEANEPEEHSHDWRPDGDSFLRTVKKCDCSIHENRYQFDHDDNCSRKRKRVRRYTCHCGESKTVSL